MTIERPSIKAKRPARGNPIDTPLRRLHEASGLSFREAATAMGLKSAEHYHVILYRGTNKYSTLVALADVLDVPLSRVAVAADVTKQNYQKTKSYQFACTTPNNLL